MKYKLEDVLNYSSEQLSEASGEPNGTMGITMLDHLIKIIKCQYALASEDCDECYDKAGGCYLASHGAQAMGGAVLLEMIELMRKDNDAEANGLPFKKSDHLISHSRIEGDNTYFYISDGKKHYPTTELVDADKLAYKHRIGHVTHDGKKLVDLIMYHSFNVRESGAEDLLNAGAITFTTHVE